LEDEDYYIFKRQALKKRKVDDVVMPLKGFLRKKPDDESNMIKNAKQIWGIIPYSYQITDIDDSGWQKLSIDFILTNISNQWQSISKNHLFNPESIYLSTEEGYRYTPDETDTSITTNGAKIPPGFEVKGFTKRDNYYEYEWGNFFNENLIFKVAQNTKGYKLHFPGYDVVDIGENIESNISHTPNRFPIEILNRNSVLTIDEYRKIKVEKAETTNVQEEYRVTMGCINNHRGYNQYFPLNCWLIGKNMVLYGERETRTNDGTCVGPGKTVNEIFKFKIQNGDSEFMLLINDYETASHVNTIIAINDTAYVAELEE